ncbi:ATP-binding cassette domain-containing protein [Teredinibacter sp. KSP-S5-2]|uniref:ATP-binding cassette domain-containing protein n=1 Tax=Teredinibacter sp. KSP-S5-2 TaxID=3034506 RepID=UPI002934C71C|nr:ATP-binding cassette domain-containing protein [Teredinibacter sp. KSP-S5-2]WNO10919.1 ATP-binding cassette domain-containing protein [Teredinibacter sp. KSP-S5-2]
MIQLTDFSLQRGSKFLFENSSATIHPSQKCGVIGGNGSGKSSFFKLLLREITEDSGSVSIPKEWRIAHMAQEVHASDRSATDYVLDGDQQFREIEAAIATCEDGEKLGNLYAQFEQVDGYSAPSRAQQLLRGLGFSSSDENRPVSDFSGGWRIRLNLAQALMCPSNLLLLDEPTNHLDLDATLWLEQWLQFYSGTLLIISHDRDFLDNVIDHVLSIENQKLITYKGNYSAYEKQKAERIAQQAAAYTKQQERIAEIENFVRRFKAKASKAKQAQSRLKELERMEQIAPAHVDSPFSFRFPTADKTSQALINLSDASLGYGETSLVSKANLNILQNSRIGLLGHNGAGKSTLIKSLAKEIPLIAGEYAEGIHLKIGYFAQHQLEALDLAASAALHIQRISPKASEQEIRNFLGNFGFQGDRAFETITHFSGGEKARLALALIAWQRPNLLLLDEPTNHLDLEVRHALTIALQTYEGAIVIVSHDRHLLNNTVDDFWLVDSGQLTPFDGTLDDYHDWLKNDFSANEHNSQTTKAINKETKKSNRQNAAVIREKLKPYTNAIQAIERKLSKMQQELETIETRLSDTSLYESNNNELSQLLKDQGQLRQSIETLEEEWLSKHDEVESLKASLEA